MYGKAGVDDNLDRPSCVYYSGKDLKYPMKDEKRKCKLHRAIFVLMVFFIGCDEDQYTPVVTDPNKAILGKWEITHQGTSVIENPLTYEEYLDDSVLLVYNYPEKAFHKMKYWFSDSLLFKRSVGIGFDGVEYDTIVMTFPYRYEFLEVDKLRLDLQKPAMIRGSIYKRIR